MKFREYGEVKPLTITATQKEDLDVQIEKIGKEADIIDLQFAITYISPQVEIIYSALLLIRKDK